MTIAQIHKLMYGGDLFPHLTRSVEPKPQLTLVLRLLSSHSARVNLLYLLLPQNVLALLHRKLVPMHDTPTPSTSDISTTEVARQTLCSTGVPDCTSPVHLRGAESISSKGILADAQDHVKKLEDASI